MTEEQRKQAVKMLADLLVETVAETGEQGAPGGVMYAALMGYGMTLEQFQGIMQCLVDMGKLTKRGHVYYAPRH